MNDIIKHYKRKSLIKNSIIILITALIIFLIFLLIDIISDGDIVNMINKISPALARSVVTHKSGYIVACVSVVFIIVFMILLNWHLNDSTKIMNSIDSILNNDDEFISLSSDLKELETKLNSIKYDVIKNENAAKESEQRKNDLIIYLAHDLKTPLTSVIGYLTLLNNEANISDENKEKFLNISLNKAQHLEDLINEFFEITRFNLHDIQLDKQDIDLSIMLLQLSDEFYPLYSEKNIICVNKISDGLTIHADSNKLARVFDNILRNAITYSDTNSEIIVSAYEIDDGVRISFSNHGATIPQNKLDDIFEKFYRVDKSRSSQTGGSGLGLAIAKEIVLLHGGDIYAVSEDNITEFHVELPI